MLRYLMVMWNNLRIGQLNCVFRHLIRRDGLSGENCDILVFVQEIIVEKLFTAAVTSVAYSLANRITARTVAGVTASPAWDANGSLVNDGTRAFTWDSRNRLTAIAGAASFTRDRFGRRATATRAGVTTRFLYDGWDVVQEKQGASVSADLLLGLGVDERLMRMGARRRATCPVANVAQSRHGPSLASNRSVRQNTLRSVI